MQTLRYCIKKLVSEALSFFGENLTSIVLFRSVARCEARKDSDVDLLIILRSALRSHFEKQDLFMNVEERLNGEIEKLRMEGYNLDFSPITKTEEEALKIIPLYLDMIEDAVILYDRELFFEKILEKLHKRLKELGQKSKNRQKVVLEAEERLQIRRGNRILNNLDMTKSYIKQAEARLIHAKEATERGNYSYSGSARRLLSYYLRPL